jgi:hypothetical protein
MPTLQQGSTAASPEHRRKPRSTSRTFSGPNRACRADASSRGAPGVVARRFPSPRVARGRRRASTASIAPPPVCRRLDVGRRSIGGSIGSARDIRSKPRAHRGNARKLRAAPPRLAILHPVERRIREGRGDRRFATSSSRWDPGSRAAPSEAACAHPARGDGGVRTRLGRTPSPRHRSSRGRGACRRCRTSPSRG